MVENKPPQDVAGLGPDGTLVPITTDDLLGASTQFAGMGKGDMFYDMALRLLQAGFEIEACVLFLSTWNPRRFQRAMDSDINRLKEALSELQDDFAELAAYSIQSIDFAKHADRIARMFDTLKLITGVEYTGATKVMHLKLPALFVMWDIPIRGEEDQKYYEHLNCVTSRKWQFRKYETTGKDYVRFLTDVQGRVRDLRYPTRPRTLAKAIDEFHYFHITNPIQSQKAKENAERKAKEKADKKAKKQSAPTATRR